MPEQWKPVPGTDDLYEVSDQGRVRSYVSRRGRRRLLNPKLIGGLPEKPKGYRSACICYPGKKKQNQNIHVLVAEAFLGPRPPGMEVRHLDGDKHNNCLSNLAYGTRKQNAEDMVSHGSSTRGSRHPFAKLTEDEVLEIIQAPAGNAKKLASQYGVSESTIYKIRDPKCHQWKHLKEPHKLVEFDLIAA